MSTEASPFHGLTRASESQKKYNLPDMALGDLPMTDLHHPDREAMRVYFHKTYERFESVFEALNCEEAFFVKPVHKLRHPIVFYLGHTACFYINKLVVAGVTSRINPKFEEMFAIGVDEMSWDDLNEDHYEWPPVAEVFAYRQQVRDRMEELFRDDRLVLEAPLTFEKSTDSISRAFYWVVNMGIEHEGIHLETMSVHVRELPMKYIRACPLFAPCKESGEAPQNELVEFPGGIVTVGRPKDDKEYGWDCDYGLETFEIQPLKVSKYTVTNKEYLDFIQDGGYTTERYWDEEGWGWVTWKKPVRPYFWVSNTILRTQTDEIPMPWDWPVDVNNLDGQEHPSADRVRVGAHS
jgi:5-histidylcysteine sulfoxide synthase